MMNVQVSKLLSLRNRNKFSVDKWKERLLNPSSVRLCNQLENSLNNTIDKLLVLINDCLPREQLRESLIESLNQFNILELDTEEKEFVGDYFHEIASFIDLEFDDQLNIWLYGLELGSLINKSKTNL